MDSRRTYEWSEREDAVLGTMADVAVGELLGTSEAMVRVRRRALGIPPSKEPLDPTPVVPHLGKTHDTALAKRFSLSKGTVMKWRRARGIPPYRGVDWDAWDCLLGTEFDKVIAERIGVTAAAVLLRRKARGIPPKRWSTKPDPKRR